MPRAAALTVDAYRCFVDAAELGPLLAALSNAGDEQGMNAAAEEVAEVFVRACHPAPVRDAIRGCYDYVSAGGIVAVRSSAVAEDSVSASFAGQYRSLLDIGADDVEEAVRLCWASLWTRHARAYRSAKGLADADVAMAVVVQATTCRERISSSTDLSCSSRENGRRNEPQPLVKPPGPQIATGGGQRRDTVPPGLLTSECEVAFSSSLLPAQGTLGYRTGWQQAPADDSPVGGRVRREVPASGARAWPLAAAISGEHSDGH